MVLDVYEQYFNAEAEFNGIPRKAAIVKLTSDSEAGFIRYTVSVNFFPFRDPEDFLITSDAYFEKEIYAAKGRRSKKREKKFMDEFRETVESMVEEPVKILWDQPIMEPRYA